MWLLNGLALEHAGNRKVSFLSSGSCHFFCGATLSVCGVVELKREANSDFGRLCVTELEKMGWFENCWAKLSPFQKVLPIIKDKAHTAFQTWIFVYIL